MNSNRFLQIHYLTSYPTSLLNRDDLGFAKRIPFGGVSRLRVSSQCLKRHWRTNEGQFSLKNIDVPMAVRSRETFERCIFTPLKQEFGESLAKEATQDLMGEVLGSKKEKKEDSKFHTEQLIVLGRPEIDYLLKVGRELCEKDSNEKNAILKGIKSNLQAMRKSCAGLDGALFGRMVTSDILQRVDAAIHVAHAFTVHEESTENDYFTAIDDLREDLGSAMLGTTELTSGLYYGYVVVDLPLLISNLSGCKTDEWKNQDISLTESILRHLLGLIATVSPGAKLGSTAPYSYAQFMMLEMGKTQPCTLANAFLKPIKNNADTLSLTVQGLLQHAKELDQTYNLQLDRKFICSSPNLPAIKENKEWHVDSMNLLNEWLHGQLIF